MCLSNRVLLGGALILLAACGGDPSESELTTSGSADDVNYFYDWVAPEVEEPEEVADDSEVLIDPGPCDGLPDGAPCDDANLCTSTDTCVAGFCVPGDPLDCGRSDGTGCQIAFCDPDSGCVVGTAADGTQCAIPCYTHAQCTAGECLAIAGRELECPIPDDPCIDSMACDPETNQCTISLYKLACPKGSICQGVVGGKLSCVPLFKKLCQPCNEDSDCKDPLFPDETQQCIPVAGDLGSFCGADCSTHACPDGFKCVEQKSPDGEEAIKQCVLVEGGQCECKSEWAAMLLSTFCTISNPFGACDGQRICTGDGLTACDAQVPGIEICDGLDNDCDGQVDEDTQELCGSPGACCMDGGECVPLYEQSCVNNTGKFQGIGVECAQAACDAGAKGACCLPNQECAALFAGQCIGLGGSYKGDGFNCLQVDCAIPDPTGACCHTNATCGEFTAQGCLQQKGYYQGNQVGCEAVVCKPKGACCLTNGQCQISSTGACNALNGLWNKGFECGQVACLPAAGMGACCLSGGGCAVLQPEECNTQDGDFLVGENCFGQCGGAELGACCYMDGSCANMGDGLCPLGATWQGLGSTCGDPPCSDDPTGACCVIDGCYEGFTATECATLPGDFQGPDTTCDACN